MQKEIAKKNRGPTFMGIPSYTDEKGRTVHKASELVPALVGDVNTSNHFERRVKTMNTDIEKATQSADDALKIFENAMVKIIRKQEELAVASKKASGNIRQSANDLSEGLIKLEKSANFHNLEKYAELLERCANSLSTLAELQKAGLLEKISVAIK